VQYNQNWYNFETKSKILLSIRYHESIVLPNIAYNRFVKILSKNKYKALLTCLFTDEIVGNSISDFAKCIFNIWERQGTILDLLKILIEREVQMTEERELLFRQSNFVTKIIECYIIQHGKEYLNLTLREEINNIHKYMSNHTIESLLESKKEKWPLKIVPLLDKTWESILNSVYSCPRDIRDLLAFIYETCNNK